MPIERGTPIESREQWLSLRAMRQPATWQRSVARVFGCARCGLRREEGPGARAEQTEAMKRGLWGEAAVFEALTWGISNRAIRRSRVYLRDP
jgi:hypothetical protein